MSSALESRLRQEGRAEAQAHAQAQIHALKQGRAEAQTAAQNQIQALLQERDDLQVRLAFRTGLNMQWQNRPCLLVWPVPLWLSILSFMHTCLYMYASH